jgi:autophagy-related protein 11
MDRDGEAEEEAFCRFTNEVYIDYDVFRDAVSKRFGDIEHLARKLQRETRQYRERTHRAEDEVRRRLALHSFKEGDLVLFLPTRDPTRDPNPWAAFNVGAPHYFLNQKDDHQLANREYLLARITHIEERVVNKATDTVIENPFDLSDGLRWHLLDATPQW